MKAGIFLGAAALLGTSALSGAAHAAPSDVARPLVRYVPGGMIIVPRSSQVAPGRQGLEAHTNLHIFQPAAHPLATAPYGDYESAASLACVYGVTSAPATCNPRTLTTVSKLGSKAVAIVDAFDYPNAMSDLNVYSSQYGLPAVSSSNLKIMYGAGSKPGMDSTGGWELEEALDLDMVHAMAPNATIILVEASSNSNAALLQAETVAADAVSTYGGGEVTNSWGGGESSSEANNESYFTKSGVVFFASTGDRNGTESPSVLSNVVGVGGTTIKRTGAGDYSKQTTWKDTGGGISRYISRPAFQNAVSSVVGSHRGAPDVAANANPGAWIYDTNNYEGRTLKWAVVGGTSEASPLWAGIVNAAGSFAASSTAELTTIYANLGTSNFYDVKAGTCGNAANGKTAPGYDLCTGVGAPTGLAGK